MAREMSLVLVCIEQISFDWMMKILCFFKVAIIHPEGEINAPNVVVIPKTTNVKLMVALEEESGYYQGYFFTMVKKNT